MMRWNIRDRIQYAGGDNLYAYVLGNPVRYFDNGGKVPELTLPIDDHFPNNDWREHWEKTRKKIDKFNNPDSFSVLCLTSPEGLPLSPMGIPITAKEFVKMITVSDGSAEGDRIVEHFERSKYFAFTCDGGCDEDFKKELQALTGKPVVTSPWLEEFTYVSPQKR